MNKSAFKYIKSIIFYMILTHIATHMYPQNQKEIDSLTNQINEDKKNTELVINYSRLSYLYKDINPQTAINYAMKGLSIADSLNFEEGRARCLMNIAGAYTVRGNAILAIEYALQSIEISKKADLKIILARNYTVLGDIYFMQQAYTEAEKYYSKSLRIGKETGNKEIEAIAYYNIGNINMELNNGNIAIKFLDKAFDLFKSTSNMRFQAWTLKAIGDIYFSSKEFSAAEKHYLKALNVFKSLKNTVGVANITLDLGHIQYETNNFTDALELYKKAEQTAEQNALLQERNLCFKGLSKTYNKLKDFENAYAYLKKFKQSSDSIHNNQTLKVISNYEQDLKLKKLKLEQLNKDLTYQKEKTKNTVVTHSLFTGLAFLLFITVYLYMTYRLKTKTNNVLKSQNDEISKQKKMIQSKNVELNMQNAQIVKHRDELKELNATKDKFFSIISHDLRNPFNYIIGFTELISTNIKNGKYTNFEKYINLINKEAKNTYNLLENLLDWSRSQTGRITYQPEKIDLSKFAEEVIDELESSFNSKKILAVNNIKDSIEVKADHNMLHTVFRNLLTNAIKYTHKQGQIELTAIKNENMAEITVKDNGVGINDEIKNDLFKIDVETTTKGTANESGTGLGLILCKEFVERHNGKIWVESKINEGSKFTFTIPVNLN